MRIVIVSHYALPHLGGIEVAVDGLARALTANGHDVVHIASAGLRGDEPAEAPPRPYALELIPAWNGPERTTGLPYPVLTPRLRHVLRAHLAGADVVHCHGYLYMSTAAALSSARTSDAAPLRVVTEHVAQVPYDNPVVAGIQRAAAATVGRAALRRAEGVVVLNANVAAEVARLAPGLPWRLIGNGVDTERFRPPAPGERDGLRRQLGWGAAPYALFVGRLVEKKGVGVVLEAAARLPEVRFAIAGPGAAPARVPANVELLGALPPSRIAELYRAADAFVLPSRGEGFPVTAQEAMATGLPVVLGEDRSYAPLLAGAGHAVTQVAPEGNALARALSDLFADPSAMERASSDAVRHALTAFSWSRAAEEHERFYAELRAARSPAHAADRPRTAGPSTDGRPREATVVIPTLRGGERLASALESLGAQTKPARKVVVVDNGARADTQALVATRFPDVQLIVNDVNAGFGRAVNQGARVAVGDALVVINDDVVLRPEFLERALESFDDTDVGMVAGVLVQGEAPARIDAAGLEFDTTLRAWDLAWNRPLAGLRSDAIAAGPCGGAALYRLSAFRDVGGFDETLFAYWEDADLALRLRHTGWRCAVATAAVAEHHHGATLGISHAQRKLDAFGRGYLLARYRVVERRPLKALAVALLDWPPLIAHVVLRREVGPIRARRHGVLAGRSRRRSSPPPYELATVGLLEALWRQWRFLPLRLSGRLPAHFGGDRVEAPAESRR